jgi:NDP-sugar pyrophosphorylase family protein
MKALILAAGEGTRLRPFTLTCPKPMLPVGGAPLLAHLFRWLRGQGVTEVAINLHHLPEVLTDYVGDGSRFGVVVTYSREDPILGSAGAAKKLEWYFDSTFLVVYGDMLLDVDLAPLIGLHERSRAELTTGLMYTADPASKGIAQLDAAGRIVRFVEKPKPGEIEGNLAAAGVYLVEPSVLGMVPPGVYCDFGHDLVPRLLAEGVVVYGRLLEGYLLDIGTPESYRDAQEDVHRLGHHWAPDL